MSDQVDITDVPLDKLISEVYNLSNPQGLGFLHYIEGPIPDDILDQTVQYAKESLEERGEFWLDYLSGRACKFRAAIQADEKLYMSSSWYDHDSEDFQELCSRLGVS